MRVWNCNCSKGGTGVNGAPPGDLLLSIQFAPHERYEHDGSNLRLVVPLTLLEALEGGKIKVPTPDGAIRVNIPAGANSGTVMRIKGRGLPRSKDQRGDLHLVLHVVPPQSSDEALEHARALETLYNSHPRSDWD